VPIPLPVFPTRRLVLVRFTRGAPAGEPQGNAPDIDERGYLPPFQGPVASVTAGSTVQVGLQRFLLESSTPLFVESSDPGVVKVADPASGALPADQAMVIRFTGVDAGTDQRAARLRIRMGTITGPIIHELNVFVFRPLSVRVTPHLVTINSSSAAGVAPRVDIGAVMRRVADIWAPAGVTFSVQPTRPKSFTFTTVNIVGDSTTPRNELPVLFADRMPDRSPNFVPNTINVYFVVQVGVKFLGLGFSRAAFRLFGMPNPAIVLGERSGAVVQTEVIKFAQTLAHEFGHFFTLDHVAGAQIPNEREDTWSRRMLMHPFSPNLRGVNSPGFLPLPDGTPFKSRPRFDDVGYGLLASGCLITLKDVPQVVGDAEIFTARAAISSPAGPF
jgi:hypothetical protein